MQNSSSAPNSPITGATVLAIISVVLAAGWIAFAYYKGGSTDAAGNRILLLHPIVAMLLIFLLIRVYRWVEIKIVATLEIVMIALWLFVTLFGVLTPFILGFGFAYLLRFISSAIPFDKTYQRRLAMVAILILCSGVFFWTSRQIGRQASQMGKGLQKFYHESVLPFVVGETLEALAVEETDARLETAPTEAKLYLGTNHGVYVIEGDARAGITNGDIVGKRIQALALAEKVLYAGTPDGLYTLALEQEKAAWAKFSVSRDAFGGGKNSDDVPLRNPSSGKHPAEQGKHLPALTMSTKPPFPSTGVQAIHAVSMGESGSRVYVGTAAGIYASDDAGETWVPVSPDVFAQSSIVSIASDGEHVYVATKSVETEALQTTLFFAELGMQGGSSTEWEALPSAGLTFQSLAVGTNDGSGRTLYAGTTSGLYHFNSSTSEWQEAQGKPHLPTSISVLASVSSHMYAGNKTVIRHTRLETAPTGGDGGGSDWQLAVAHKEGRFNTLQHTQLGLEVQKYLTERIPSLAQSGGTAIKWLSTSAGSLAFRFGGFLATLSFTFIVFVYAGQKFEDYIRSLTSLIPEPHREKVKTHLREIDRNMQAFLRGQVAVIAIVSVISCLAYGVIGVPFALLVGLLAGFCNAIPTFGPIIGGVFAFIAMLMGLAAGDFTLGWNFGIRCLAVLGAILGIQTIDNSLISPKVMSSAVDVDALLIMFGVIVGGALLGFWGVLLAIPILVIIKSVISVNRSSVNRNANGQVN